MIGLPKTTEFNKRIPKQKFYDNMENSTSIKKIFAEQVKLIYWKNKIATETMTLAPGNNVQEIEVFEIQLNQPSFDENLLRQIDEIIPYHILFLMEYQGRYQVWVGYKDSANFGKKSFQIKSYYHTKWFDENESPLRMEGLNIDAVYENFVRQIAGDKLIQSDFEESLKESVDKEERRKALQKKITALQSKIRKEKQLNKQMEMNNELKKLRRELEGI
ncbi:MAG: DUF4391 domain-containing protein [Peptostreptococcaceae bacterium]|nr:DUF4391 domain-containing protein [Peptostreptococcaceae bacterium]